MSRHQFDRWLCGRGVEQRNGRYYLPCTGVAKDMPEDNALTVVMSTGAPDRQGDILEPNGADLAAFRRNPVVLWAHQYDQLPVARAEQVWLGDGQLNARIVFDTRPFAREVRRLYAEGFLAGWSVGCLPRKWKVIEDEEGRFAGYHVTEWELLELSAVPVPANPEALTRELRGGRIADLQLCKTLGELLNGGTTVQVTNDADAPVSPSNKFEGGALSASPADRDGDSSASPAVPEVSLAALADALAPRLKSRLREWAGRAAEREIRRRQGRIV